jgi:poly(hydroxyalkanoate) depolymerase family esterase
MGLACGLRFGKPRAVWSSTKEVGTMNHSLRRGVLAATRMVMRGRLGEATAALQRRLLGDTQAEREPLAPDTPTGGLPHPGLAAGLAPLRGMLDRVGGGLMGAVPGVLRPDAPPATEAEGAAFKARSFTNAAGTRPYRVYVPSGYRPGHPAPLIVMLHGCTQSPEDFAAGTRMNEAAEAATCLVAYPGQIRKANVQKCWNWFAPADQQRDSGEPSLIAGITREVMGEFSVDPRRVYVAGLSAGGAAAAIMAQTYPDLYAAAGVHSGLACGAAHDMPSAFAAMQRGSVVHRPAAAGQPVVPCIVFHGDSDATVNPRNAGEVIAQAVHAVGATPGAEQGQAPAGHSYTRTQYRDGAGQVVAEQWVVHGGGHAWFGGSPAGSYTDPAGPDATAEMLRFFLQHPR